MRFGIMVAAAAALLCGGQADAARYYEFELKASAASTITQYDVLLNFVFDTLSPAFPGFYQAVGYNDTINLDTNITPSGRGFLYDLPTPDGPEFRFQFNFSDIANASTLSSLAISDYGFVYNQRVDPRYSLVNRIGGSIYSIQARTTDVAPGYSGLISNITLSAVPEPASWAMMILGFGIVGTATRARKRRYVNSPALA